MTLWYMVCLLWQHSHHIKCLTEVRDEVSGVVTSPHSESGCKVSGILDITPPGEVLVKFFELVTGAVGSYIREGEKELNLLSSTCFIKIL